MNRFIAFAFILWACLSYSFGQATSKQTIRWGSPDLPKECCNNYMRDGILITSYQDVNLGYVASLHPDWDDKYVIAMVYFQNKSDKPITVYPNNFQLHLTAPVNKTFGSVDISEVAKEIEKRGNTGRFWRSFRARMSRNIISANTVSSGDFRVYGSGGSASSTYNGTSNSTISVPDSEARERAQLKNEEELAENRSLSEKMRHFALLANTLQKGQVTGGIVFFKKVGSPGAVLTFTINDIIYEIPYGNERLK